MPTYTNGQRVTVVRVNHPDFKNQPATVDYCEDHPDGYELVELALDVGGTLKTRVENVDPI